MKLLRELRAQGFVRSRIAGLHRKHTIEVVVDRFKVSLIAVYRFTAGEIV